MAAIASSSTAINAAPGSRTASVSARSLPGIPSHSNMLRPATTPTAAAHMQMAIRRQLQQSKSPSLSVSAMSVVTPGDPSISTGVSPSADGKSECKEEDDAKLKARIIATARIKRPSDALQVTGVSGVARRITPSHTRDVDDDDDDEVNDENEEKEDADDLESGDAVAKVSAIAPGKTRGIRLRSSTSAKHADGMACSDPGCRSCPTPPGGPSIGILPRQLQKSPPPRILKLLLETIDIHKIQPFKLKSLSFSGCGLHLPYLMSASQCLLQRGITAEKYYGVSGGVYVCAAHIMAEKITVDETMSMYPFDQPALRRNQGMCQWIGNWCRSICCCRHPKALQQMSPHTPGSDNEGSNVGIDLVRDRAIHRLCEMINRSPDTYKRMNGRLHVTVAEVSCRLCCSRHATREINQWENNEDLIRCIKATSEIPTRTGPYALGQRWRGKMYVDGGVQIMHPIEDFNTICVSTSPFSVRKEQPAYRIKAGEIDAKTNKPKFDIPEIGREITMSASEILGREEYQKLWQLGWMDTEAWLKYRYHISVTKGYDMNSSFACNMPIDGIVP